MTGPMCRLTPRPQFATHVDKSFLCKCRATVSNALQIRAFLTCFAVPTFILHFLVEIHAAKSQSLQSPVGLAQIKDAEMLKLPMFANMCLDGVCNTTTPNANITRTCCNRHCFNENTLPQTNEDSK